MLLCNVLFSDLYPNLRMKRKKKEEKIRKFLGFYNRYSCSVSTVYELIGVQNFILKGNIFVMDLKFF